MLVPYPSILRLKALQVRFSGFHIRFGLCENHFCVHNLRSRFAQRIHLSDPLHWMFDFKFFGYTLTLRSLLYQPKEHFLCLFINIRKIAVQLAAYHQISVKYPFVLTDILPVSLSLYPYGFIFFGWRGKIRQVVVALQRVSTANFFK